MSGDDERTVGGAPQDEGFVSFYRRFRPGRFSEIWGQPHVVRALQSAVRDDKVAHAYLFSGPRGTGKTSSARILARALNCADLVDGEPCGVCSSCVEIARGTSLDVHELDAASNNGVDAMRDLVAHAALGTPGRWKIYIVDEVHMLSNAAANALLKTLEEPPGHVVFVLATTDPQKVPPTIRSRTQHFEFRLLGAETLLELLRGISGRAGLQLDDEALAVVVRRARGSARDALTALDQVAASGSAEDVRAELTEAFEALCEDDAGRLLVAVAALHEAGWGPQQLASELVDELRQTFLVALAPELAAASGAELDRLMALADRLGLVRIVRAMEVLGRAQVDMREAPDPRVVLEVAAVRLARADLDDSPAALTDRVARVERRLAETQPAPGSTAPARAEKPLPSSGPAGSAGRADVVGQPALGALRRQRGSQVPNPQPEANVSSEPALRPPDSQQAATEAVAAASVPPRAESAAPPDRDAVVEAWGDHILRALPARAKALYSAGRFVSVQDARASFALPNAAHRDRCKEVQGMVEEAIATYFGVPVPLDLVVDAVSPGTNSPSAGPGRIENGSPGRAGGVGAPGAAVGRPDEPDDEDFDPNDPGEPIEVESLAEARLLEAFPGAEQVSE